MVHIYCAILEDYVHDALSMGAGHDVFEIGALPIICAHVHQYPMASIHGLGGFGLFRHHIHISDTRSHRLLHPRRERLPLGC